MNELYKFDCDLKADYDYVCGIDEVGRGALCGIIASCGIVLKPEAATLNITDSKKLSEATRDKYYDKILEVTECYAIKSLEAPVIDHRGIQYANRTVMQMVKEEISNQLEGRILFISDGNPLWREDDLLWFTQADSKSLSVAAASIIAKVYRDRLMIELDKEYPLYKFGQHKGYGTKIHKDAIRQNGILKDIHRKSFLKDILNQNPELF